MSQTPSKKTVTIINGALGGSSGNSAVLLELAASFLSARATVQRITLSEKNYRQNLQNVLSNSDAYLFGTGTYWDSWGSPLQIFLEEVTSSEGSDIWLGKPAGAIVTMHSVGGKGVLSRLQGVLQTFGALVPPMSGMVYSAANQLALEAPPSDMADDLWRPSDVEILCHNLLEACFNGTNWRSWPTDGEHFAERWIKDTRTQ